MPLVRHRATSCLRSVAALALLWSIAPSAPARSVHAEAAIGLSRFMDRGDGVWYQQALPHKLRPNSPALMLGLHGTLGTHAGRRFDWHADAFYLGRTSADSCAVMDTNYDPRRHVCPAHCDQLSHFIASGKL